MTYKEEMESFKKHLVEVLPLMEADEDIEYLVANIRSEYIQWSAKEIDDLDTDYNQQLSDDLFEYEQATRCPA